jgi:hypothetical protein
MTGAQERTLAPSETAERLATALVARAGSRVTAEIAEIFEAIDAVEPSLATAPWKRERIGELLAELAAAGFLAPSRTRFDRSEAPALPAFVRLVARRAPGRIVAAAAGYPWRPELAWAASEPLLEREFEQLKAVQAFLRDGGANRRVVPAPERSVELFGHEKALDEELRPSRLWADGRLSYVLLRCRPAATPLPHRVVGRGSWLLVAENAAAFDSIAASIPDGSPVGIVGWGGGGLFRSTVESIAELPAITAREEIAAIRYFGDLDVEGLRIPIAASAAAERVGLPPVRPAVGLYARLLAVGRPQRATPVAPEVAAELTAWLGSALAPQAAALLVSGYRLAQEVVGLDQLVENRLWATPAGLGPGRTGTPIAAAAAATPRPQRTAQPALFSGELVLIRDNDGREIVPRTEAEWADWVPAARTRNWVRGDPLLDWLHAHGSEHGFLRDDERPGYDPRTDFQRLLREKGIAFEAGVLRLLERRVPVRVVARAHGDGRSLEKARETLDALRQGVPVVAQAVLRDPESRTFGVADLLVRSDVLATWFPELLSWEDATVGAPGLGHARFHYRAIDIKFHTFELAADGHVVGSVDQLAYAVEVWIYADALARLQGYIPPAAYLLGRTWQRVDERGDGCLDRLARVDVDRWLANRKMSLANLVRDATAWIRRLRDAGHQWHVFPEPSVPELYPHARNPEDTPWHAAKREIAERLGELTLLPAMNPERRAVAHASGYRRWTDPGVSAAILGVTSAAYAARIDAVLEANRQAAPTVIPHRMTKADPMWREIRPVEFFVDFETVSNLDDDLVCLPAVGGQPQIVQVGCGHLDGAGCWVFAQWTADALDVGEERRILDAWLGHMASVCRAADVTLVDARICHWSAAEPVNLESAYNAARTRHRDGDWPAEMPWFDVLQCVIRAEPVSVTGAFNFGLKAIAKAMHDAGFIQTTWKDGPTDGLGAMTATWSAAREAVARGLPLSQHELIVEIGHYNEVDCRVMAEVLQWLRSNR